MTSSLYIIGNYYKNRDDLDNAEKYIKLALETINLHDRAEDYLEKEIIRNPGSIVNPRSALNHYNDMILSYKASSYASLGFVSSRKGKREEAIEYEKRAGEYMKENLEKYAEDEMREKQDIILYACHLVSLSDLYSQNSQYEESNECARKSIEYFKKVGRPEYYRSYWQLAQNMYYADLDSALFYALQALEVTHSYGNLDDKQRSLSILAQIYVGKKEYNSAEKYLSDALDILQGKIRREIVSMTIEQKQRLWSLNEFKFLLYRDIIAKCDLNGVLISKLLNYSLFSKSLILDSEIVNEEKHKRLVVIWKDIQEKLSNKDIAIEFITTRNDLYEKNYHALVIDKTCEYPQIISLFSETDLKELKQKESLSDLEVLGNLIWKPILNQYDRVENIYFSPDGMLYKYPIEYCNVDGIGEMMEHYNIYRLSSTKEIIFRNTEAPKTNAILYGGLNYETLATESTSNIVKNRNSLLRSISARGGFEPLDNTLKEVQEIDSLLTNKNVSSILFTDEKGTEESFKYFSGKDVNMIHLSTHGMYIGPDSVNQKKIKNNYNFLELIRSENDPVQEDIVLTHSFLVMSGGNKLIYRETISPQLDDDILTAFEISQLDLRKVDLVVLSACETGLGDLNSGGVYGLQRGFKKAGTNTILMSLDKVDDEATKILMVEFYKNLMSGKSKHKSLIDSQKQLRMVDNGKYDKPEYWASFILLDGLN